MVTISGRYRYRMTSQRLASDQPPTSLPVTRGQAAALLDPATRDQVAATVRASKAPNTVRAYQSDLRQVAAWLATAGHRDLVQLDQAGRWQLVAPLGSELLAGYLVQRAEQGATVTTLRRHLASVSKWHQLAGVDNPCSSSLVRDTLAGLRRLRPRAPRRAAPLLPDDLARLVAGCDANTASGLRDRALLLLGWCAALRRSELAALTWGQVESVQGGLLLTVQGSKTDHSGEGQQVGVPYQSSPELCPVRALHAWRQLLNFRAWQGQIAQCDPAAPVFRQVNRAGTVLDAPLSGQAVAQVVQRRAATLGLVLSGHSLRAGLATAAIAAGRSEHEVMRTTRHRSQAVFRGYVRDAELLPKAASRGLL
jgi:site-specific recombinase XerD